MRKQHKIGRSCVKWLMISGVAAMAVACGGPQPDGGGGNGGNGGNGGGNGGNGGGGTEDNGPTEEELEQQRLDAAAGAFERAGRLYAAGTVETRDYNEIIDLLEEAIESDPTLAEARFNIGRALYEQGDVEAAIAAYEAAGQMGDSYGRGMANIGYIQLMEGDVSTAEQTFTRCVELAPLEPGCNINLSIMYRERALETGDDAMLQTSIDHLRFALGGEANNAEAYANLARAYFEQGRYELARLVCENAILQGIDDAVLHNRLGLVALSLDDVIVAYQEFQEAVAQRPDYTDAQMNIGAMALSFRDYTTAHASFEVVLSDDPENIGALLSRGVARRGMDRFEEAEADYCQVLQLDSGNSDAVYNLALLFEAHQHYPLAISYYNQYVSQSPNGPHSEDSAHKAFVLADLMDALVEMGDYTAPDLTPICPI